MSPRATPFKLPNCCQAVCWNDIGFQSTRSAVTTAVVRMKQSAIVISPSKNVVKKVGEERNEGRCSSASSEVGLADRICMDMTFNIPAHKSSYSRPKMQIVSYVRIQAVPLSHVNSSRSVTVKVWRRIEACCFGKREYLKHCLHA